MHTWFDAERAPVRALCTETVLGVIVVLLRQVCVLQGEQRSLLSALEAVESALQDARQSCDEQTTLRQRYEASLQTKTQTISDLKRELKEARKAAEQVCN